MNGPSKDDVLLDVFKSATADRNTPDGPHFVDDDELLISWSLGEIDDQRQAELRGHMAGCSYCRKELAAMVRAGALQLPEVEEQPVSQSARPAAPAKRSSRGKGLTWLATAVAATLLIGIVWSISDTGSQQMLAMVEKDLAADKPAAAMDRAEKLLEKEDLDAKQREKARELMEESGYRLGCKSLRSSDFDTVVDVEQRASKHGLSSARLASLRWQAEREIPAELALSQSGNLLDYDYDLGGVNRTKSIGFPSFDEKMQPIIKGSAEAVEKYPDSLDLRLNYAQLLLEEGKYEEAERQFKAALAIDEKSVLAHIGLGLVRYHQERYDDASKSFAEAAELAPNNFDAQLNAAICQERLSKEDKAVKPIDYWRKALELTDDPDLKRRIEKQMLTKGIPRNRQATPFEGLINDET